MLEKKIEKKKERERASIRKEKKKASIRKEKFIRYEQGYKHRLFRIWGHNVTLSIVEGLYEKSD